MERAAGICLGSRYPEESTGRAFLKLASISTGKVSSCTKIARQAELAVGTIYFYFRSKEEIFAALQEEGLELLLTGRGLSAR